MAEIQMYNHDCFLFVDETGCSNKDHTRKFGYALRGEPAVEHRWVHRGSRILVIATMTSGMLAVELDGSINGDFFDYVRGSLIPKMLPFCNVCFVSSYHLDKTAFYINVHHYGSVVYQLIVCISCYCIIHTMAVSVAINCVYL